METKSKPISSGTSLSSSFSSSAYKVGSSDDLLSEILIRLPRLKAGDMGFERFTCGAVIDIYNSKTRRWKVCSQPFGFQYCMGYTNHDALLQTRIKFLNRRESGPFQPRLSKSGAEKKFYKFDEDCMHQIQVPALPDVLRDFWSDPQQYLLESCGSLFFIEISPYSSAFEVYEMKKDYSGWFVRYQVDIDQVAKAFPVMVSIRFQLIQSIILGGREEDSFIVLQLPGKVIRYNLMSKTFHKLCDLIDESTDKFLRPRHFIESLYEVSRHVTPCQ